MSLVSTLTHGPSRGCAPVAPTFNLTSDLELSVPIPTQISMMMGLWDVMIDVQNRALHLAIQHVQSISLWMCLISAQVLLSSWIIINELEYNSLCTMYRTTKKTILFLKIVLISIPSGDTDAVMEANEILRDILSTLVQFAVRLLSSIILTQKILAAIASFLLQLIIMILFTITKIILFSR